MKQHEWNIRPDQLKDNAYNIYTQIASLHKLNQEHIEEGLCYRNIMIEYLDIKAITCHSSDIVITGAMINIKEKNIFLESKVFEQFKKAEVEGVYFYLISIGNNEYSSNDLMEQYYQKIWETAYLEAAREYLRSLILDQKRENYLSVSLGPGYYGMRIEEIDKIFQMFQKNSIGVILKDNQYLVPMNSNIGLFLESRREVSLFKGCELCIGGKEGCAFCSIQGD
ncbi:hypothetical protein [Anaeromicropila herbilytica]|uniref:Vitamin B12 dependent methionine synthase, activation domain n=1 Tax=Anaeromicropila herbilytica TaxID=2785025 RepID=A0A7R7IF90_9FIRM|nr:hypothetical protein [Anaeromicropila herbilytica]BCN32856.1 hypothetical protein bsdtb5_41510 [Anaeromicropila herbilytica]